MHQLLNKQFGLNSQNLEKNYGDVDCISSIFMVILVLYTAKNVLKNGGMLMVRLNRFIYNFFVH